MNSVNYFNDVLKTTGQGGDAGKSIQLYMVPGMNHCRAVQALMSLRQGRGHGIVGGQRTRAGADSRLRT